MQAMFLTLQRLFGDLEDPLLEPVKRGERDVPVLKLWDQYLGMCNYLQHLIQNFLPNQ